MTRDLANPSPEVNPRVAALEAEYKQLCEAQHRASEFQAQCGPKDYRDANHAFERAFEAVKRCKVRLHYARAEGFRYFDKGRWWFSWVEYRALPDELILQRHRVPRFRDSIPQHWINEERLRMQAAEEARLDAIDIEAEAMIEAVSGPTFAEMQRAQGIRKQQRPRKAKVRSL